MTNIPQNRTDFKIITWNARSVKNKKDDLLNLINHLNIDIVIITESWLSDSDNFGLPTFTIIRNDRVDGYGGVCICIKRHIPFTIIENHYDPNSSDLQYITFQCYNIGIMALYIPHNNIQENVWQDIIKKFPNQHIIVTGDFNINALPNELNEFSTKFTELNRIMAHNNMVCINDDTPTRLRSLNQQHTAPDLTFCTTNLISNTKWKVYPDTMNSDHFPIILTINMGANLDDKRTFRRNIHMIDWSLYKYQMNEYTNNILQSENNIELYNLTIQGIQQYLYFHHPKQSIPFKDTKIKPIWWNADCSKAVANRRRAIGQYKKHMTQNNYINLKEVCAHTKR